MLYRGWINGKMITTSDLSMLKGCGSIDIFIKGLWQVWE